MKRTIVALATPLGKGAIHIIRLSGHRTFEFINDISEQEVDKQTRVQVITLRNHQLIDKVVLVKYFSPNSYTGEDLIEINCHGNIIITQLIIDALVKTGAFLATRGEFTKQAFINKKIDLNQAINIGNLANAKTPNEVARAIREIKGESSAIIKKAIDRLFVITSLIETNIDYPPDIDNDATQIYNVVYTEITQIRNELLPLYKSSSSQKHINPRIVFVGEPNAGKSSLINFLLKEDRAIVSNTPGTTRDCLCFNFFLDREVTFVDTAGIRDNPTDDIEAAGIQKTYEEIEKATLIIQLIPPNSSPSTFNNTTLNVFTKSDLIHEQEEDKIYISVKNKNINQLLTHIQHHLGDDLCSINFQDGINLLSLAIKDLDFVLKETLTLDYAVEFLHCSRTYLMDILHMSETKTERINKMFDNFCIGK